MNQFWKGKKVLVTGAAGFVGSHVVDFLVNRNARVTALVSIRKSNYPNLSESIKRIKLIKGNLEDPDFCLRALRNQDIVLNFAAMDGGSKFKKEHSAEIFKTNSQVAINVLEAARKNRIQRLLLISSIEIYSESAPQPIKEKYGFAAGINEKIDGYAWSKRFSEIAAKMYNGQYGLNISIIRPGNIYGPRDHLSKGRVIPTFIKQALENREITLWNGGRQLKSFLYVKDFAKAALDIVEKYNLCDPVNLASGNYISIKNLAEFIIKAAKSKSELKTVQSSLEFKEKIIDIKKAKKIIKFIEHWDVESGVSEVVKYMRNH